MTLLIILSILLITTEGDGVHVEQLSVDHVASAPEEEQRISSTPSGFVAYGFQLSSLGVGVLWGCSWSLGHSVTLDSIR